MPELPDVVVYVEALGSRVIGHVLERVRLLSPFVLRSVSPPITDLEGTRVTGVSRLGKQIVFAFEHDRFLVVHLMIAGRFQWRAREKPIRGRLALASFEFPGGVLFLTEASTKKRASLHVVAGREKLAAFDRGALEVLEASRDAFAAVLTRENHTLRRALTDPRLFSGIGGAYSDEILHRARLSPLQLTSKTSDDEVDRLFDAAQQVLTEWTTRLREQASGQFPAKVTAFHPEMAVHGRFGQPCPVCGSPVRRIVYAANESNYCATCQTGGRLLADRALSRLLKKDWPRSLEDWEEHLNQRREGLE